MSIFEYNQEAHMKCVRREGYEDGMTDGIAAGKAQGIAESILDLLVELGPVSDELQEAICQESDLQKLKDWLRLAAKADSIEQFLKDI